ncbi:MAG: hypothetical protein V4722_26265 [Bacteroidota bacterium]
MKCIVMYFLFFACLEHGIAQTAHVGIGTANPMARLQINHKNTASSPALTLFDSAGGTGSKLLFSKQNHGNNFSLVSNIDVLAASSSLDIRTSFNSGIILKGNGTVGINNISNPSATLHVGGGVKVEDTLHVDGKVNLGSNLEVNNNAGIPGQVLGVNAAGNTSWLEIVNYNNVASFYYTGRDTTWTVPAGITKIMVEAWGGGGGGNRELGAGGGGGCFMRAYFKSLAAGQAVNIYVGNGGGGGDDNTTFGSPGDTTEIVCNGNFIYAKGGRGGFQHATDGGEGVGSAQNTSFGWVSIKGEAGLPKTVRYDQYGTSSFASIWQFGKGGNGGNTISTGGTGTYLSQDRGTLNSLWQVGASKATVPGGGGAGGQLENAGNSGMDGAAGMVIIHY